MYDIYTNIVNNLNINNLYKTYKPDEYDSDVIADEMTKLLPELTFIANRETKAVFSDGNYAYKVLLNDTWKSDQFLEASALLTLNQKKVKCAPTLFHISPTVW